MYLCPVQEHRKEVQAGGGLALKKIIRSHSCCTLKVMFFTLFKRIAVSVITRTIRYVIIITILFSHLKAVLALISVLVNCVIGKY